MRSSDPCSAALAQFCADGIAPDFARVVPLAPGDLPETRFDAHLVAKGLSPLSTCIAPWHTATPDRAVTLLAACRHRSLAYGLTRGAPDAHLAAARALVEALGVTRARLNSGLYTLVAPTDLSLPKRGWGFGSFTGVSQATFEEAALLVGPTHAAFVLWTDED